MNLTESDKWSKQREVYKKKRKYRAWLVGNPEELGYRQDDRDWETKGGYR